MCYQLHQTAVCRVSAPAHTLSEGVPVFADCQLIHTRHNYALWMTLKTTSSWGSPPPPAKIDRRNNMILSPKVHAYFSQRLVTSPWINPRDSRFNHHGLNKLGLTRCPRAYRFGRVPPYHVSVTPLGAILRLECSSRRLCPCRGLRHTQDKSTA